MYVPNLDVVGKRFGRLSVIEYQKSTTSVRGFLCVCDCGATVVVKGTHLRHGTTRSCGCLRKDLMKNNVWGISHGHSKRGHKSGEYQSWSSMTQRCVNPNSPNFSYYGGRGITVCARWRDSFENFLADMGSRPPGTTLDRRDNDGNYEPGNCRWATYSQQRINQSQFNKHGTVGLWLEARLKERGMTALDLSRKISERRGSVFATGILRRYIAQTKTPSRKIMTQIAAALEVEMPLLVRQAVGLAKKFAVEPFKEVYEVVPSSG